MSLNLNLKLLGMKRITDRLTEMQRKAKGDRVVFTKLAILGFKDVQDHFRRESAPDNKWPPLSPVTIEGRTKGPKTYKGESKRKAAIRRRRSPKMLQDTGTLRNSLLPASRNTYGGTRFIPNGIVLFTKLVYAAIHNFGGMAGRGRKVKIPQREFMWLSRDSKEAMKQTFKDHVMRHGA